ncbi:MAG: hypothetical protein L3V56_14805 [Candidatus Magnetoovum sp. WYHC-5]|nr:hypothetical protein [Candidatus Magnetoovum sp. WYHC-5]
MGNFFVSIEVEAVSGFGENRGLIMQEDLCADEAIIEPVMSVTRLIK